MTKRKASVALENIEDAPVSRTTNSTTNLTHSHTDANSNCNSGTTAIQHLNGATLSSALSGGNCQQQNSNNIQNDNVNSNSSAVDTGAGGNQHQKSKKERADNWSSAEIEVLHKGIESRRDIFYGPPSQATKKNREIAWEAITREVNAVSSTPRSLNQVMKKFKNEKCRAKRKFDPDKDDHNNGVGDHIHISNSSSGNNNTGNNNNNSASVNLLTDNNVNNVSNSSHNDSTNATTNNCSTNDTTSNLGAQNQSNNAQQQQHQQHQSTQLQQQSNHITNSDQSMSVPQPSINVVKLAPQNVAKTMIDLPGHVQQIQMPNDDMVLIVPPDMDGLLSGVNIVSDGNGHHHFQKCPPPNALTSNHHNQHSLQALNSGQSLVNGAMSNGMMARTIPAGSMCSLVYSTGNEVCAPEHQVAQGTVSQASLSSHHLGLSAQSLTHHRGILDQNNVQQHHHQLHQHQHQQPQQPPQQPPLQHAQHQPHLSNTLSQQHLPQSSLASTTAISSTGGVALESQLKNLLFNLLLKDGRHPSLPLINPSNQDDKHRNDLLAIIANSLSKIEGHLSRLSTVASSLVPQNISLGLGDSSDAPPSNQLNSTQSGLSGSDCNINNVGMSNAGANISANRRDNER